MVHYSSLFQYFFLSMCYGPYSIRKFRIFFCVLVLNIISVLLTIHIIKETQGYMYNSLTKPRGYFDLLMNVGICVCTYMSVFLSLFIILYYFNGSVILHM